MRRWSVYVHDYFASQARGVKSSLCLVLKIMFLVLISRMDGGCRGVAMAKSASCDRTFPPFSWRWLCPCRNFSRPWMFKACEEKIQKMKLERAVFQTKSVKRVSIWQDLTQPHSSFIYFYITIRYWQFSCQGISRAYCKLSLRAKAKQGAFKTSKSVKYWVRGPSACCSGSSAEEQHAWRTTAGYISVFF